MKRCHKCSSIKNESKFYSDKSRYDGLEAYCKLCRAAKGKIYRATNTARAIKAASKARRRAKLMCADVNFEGDERIVHVYKARDRLNKIWGTNFQVDHVIPLAAIGVSGLHTWHNLQLLDASLNASKCAKL